MSSQGITGWKRIMNKRLNLGFVLIPILLVCLGGVLTAPAFAAPQLLAPQTEVIASTAATATETASYSAPAGKNRVLVLTTSTYKASSGNQADAIVSTTTLPAWNSKTFTRAAGGILLIGTTNGHGVEQFHAAIGDSTVTQTFTLTITYKGSIDRKQAAVACFGNIDQTNPRSGTLYGTYANSGTGTGTSAGTGSLTNGPIPADYVVVDLCGVAAGAPALTATAGQTGVFTSSSLTRRYSTGAYCMAAPANKAMGYSWTGANRWGICAAAYKSSYSVAAAADTGATLKKGSSAGDPAWTDGSYDYNASVSITAVPDAGYTFVKWQANTAAQGTADTWAQVSTDPAYTFKAGLKVDQVTTLDRNGHTLQAVITPNAYTVTFDPSGGTVSPTSKTVTHNSAYGAPSGTLPTPVLAGSNFGGWWTDVYGTGTQVLATDTATLLADQTLYAKWFSPVAVTITANAITKVYGDADPPLTYTVVPPLDPGDAMSGALARDAGEAVLDGPYGITQGSLTTPPKYNVTFAGASLTITPRPLTVTANAITKRYGDDDPPLSWQVPAGSLVGGDTVGGALARVAGETVLGGPYAITRGTVDAGPNYTVTYAGANLMIVPKPLTVTADAKGKTYGDDDPALTYGLTGSLVGGDSIAGALARAPGENADTYAIAQGTVDAGPNYIIRYAGANLTINPKALTVTADAKSKTYGDDDPALTYVLAGSLLGGDTITGALARVAGESTAGSPYAIRQGTVTAGANYAIAFVPATLTISPKPLTLTADAKSKTYGDADPALTYTLTSGSLANGDAFSGALGRVAGNTVAGGPYALTLGTLTAGGNGGTNYAVTLVSATLTIAPRAVTIAADDKTKTYGNADPALTYTLTSGSLVTGDAFSGALARAAGSAVSGSPYAINQGTLAAGGNGGTNYAVTFVSANLTITARPLTVTANARTKVYGAGNPGLTYTVTSGSLATGDMFAGALSRAAGETVPGSPYAISQGTLTAGGNYTITFVPANLTITARPLTVTANAVTKILGAADPPLTFTVSSGSLVTGDTFTGALAAPRARPWRATPMPSTRAPWRQDRTMPSPLCPRT